MARVDEFDAFYYAHRRALLQQTYAVTGDLESARLSVREAYVRAWQRWRWVAARDDPDAWVRTEAWRIASREGPAGANGHVPPAELDDLTSMSPAQRRAVVLRDLVHLSDDQIAKETRTSPASVAELLDQAQAVMPDTAADGIGGRLAALRSTADTTPMSRAPSVRRDGDRRRRRRLTGWLVAAAVLVAVGTAGAVYLAGDSDSDATASSPTSPAAADTTPTSPQVRLSRGELLDAAAVTRLQPDQTWAVDSTTATSEPTRRVYGCPPSPLPPPVPTQAWTRDFTGGGPQSVATQTVELADSENSAASAYTEMAGWAAACRIPRTTLLRSYDLPGIGDEASVLVLRQSPPSAPETVVAVGLARTGTVTTSIVEVTPAPVPVRVGAVAGVLGASVAELCADGGGSCAADPSLRLVGPPEYGDATGFLAPVDLTPVPGTIGGWVGTTPAPARDSTSATLCDEADFSGTRNAESRTFVVPAAKNLPLRFGLTETVGTLPSTPAATRFVDQVKQNVAGCETRELSASVLDSSAADAPPVHASIWRFEFEINNQAETVAYRVAVLRRHDQVAEVTMSPGQGFDVTDADFTAMVVRAGERLHERD
jgi:hypothetical protein